MASDTLLNFFQGRKFWITTLAVLVLPVTTCIVGGWVYYLERSQSYQRQTSLDMVWQEQTILGTLVADQHTLTNWSYDLGHGAATANSDFVARVSGLMKDEQAIVGVDVFDADDKLSTSIPKLELRTHRQPAVDDPTIAAARARSRDGGRLVFSSVVAAESPVWAMVLPTDVSARHGGTIVAYYDLNRFMEQTVPWWFIQRYDLGLMEADGHLVVLHDGSLPSDIDRAQTISFGPPGSGLMLKVSRHDRDSWWAVIGALALVIVLLGVLVVYLLRVLQRWLQQRIDAQRALSDELRFREAMENSTATGLVAFDLQGRIIYVNPAFCRLVGLSAQQLVGLEAPFP
ncbi:MAG: PAS domain S-box protein, partial [Burkholderiales bacterium]|nr:PAS domain S-box protein [Burkholderiales bacterium]